MAVLGKFYEDVKSILQLRTFLCRKKNAQFFVVHVYLFLHMEFRNFVVWRLI